MPLIPGARVGPYEVVAQIGVGGMGEVYRAKDPGLNRDVAIKVLPDEFAQDAERLARFEREAKTLASLSHPGIAIIHGFEKTGASRALVMEFIDGPTLADRIAGGRLPIDEALGITKQIVDALEVAHEQGIVHRDLKPANIKIRPDGTVKVLDFGLAKTVEPAGVVSGRSMSPTITSPAMTQAGVILGTAAYMAPEQAKGRGADKRSDVWALGCVLYEMLTGKRAFDGEDISDTLALILRGEPDWNGLPRDLPPAHVSLLKRMLDKDRRRRVGDVAAVSFVLSEPHLVAPHRQDSGRGPGKSAWIAVALLIGAGLASAGWWAATASRTAEPKTVTRLSVPLRGDEQYLNPVGNAIALSPSGTHLAFVARGRLYVRALDRLDSVEIRGTEGNVTTAGNTRRPQFSPDGQWVAFLRDNELRKVAINGGPIVTIAAVPNFTNYSWESDGTIIYSTVRGLYRMPDAGGPSEVLVEGLTGRIQSFQLLPDGARLLYTLLPIGTINPNNSQFVVRSLPGGEETVVARGGIEARYVPTGHLVYYADGSLLTVRFDLDQLKVIGAPEPVADSVMSGAAPGLPLASAHVAISPVGMLAYARGDPLVTNARSLVWVDRSGREEPLPFPAQPYVYPRLSPDERSIGVTVRQQQGTSEVMVLDIARKNSRPFASDPADDRYSIWTPDSQRVYFGSQRGDEPAVWSQRADGSELPHRLAALPRAGFANFFPTSIAPDATALIATVTNPGGANVWMVALNGKPEPKPLLASEGTKRNGEISPGGRWLAYESIENGLMDIYVRPFPDVNAAVWRVSSGGGSQPLWARNGRELFYLDALNMLTAVTVEDTPAFVAGPPTTVLPRSYAWLIPNFAGRQYDVSRDGKRFLMLKQAGVDGQADAPTITIVQNWFEELRRR